MEAERSRSTDSKPAELERAADRSAERSSLSVRTGSAGMASASPPPPPRHRGMLQLQRLIGNRAVTRLVQRDNPPAAPATTPKFEAAALAASGAAPSTSGQSQAHADGDSVLLQAGKITMEAEAWVVDGHQLGRSGNVGYIQNLVSSDRVGVYRAGGDPNGELIAEVHDARKNRWDAGYDVTKKDKSKIEPTTFAPFYFSPLGISDDNTSRSPVKITMWDQPQAPFAKEYKNDRGAGRLTETKGQDVFKVAVGAKSQQGAAFLVNGWGHNWTAPWAAKIDASFNGKGEALQQSEIKDLLRDGPDPKLTTWSFTEKGAQVFEGFSTVEEANKRSASELLKWLAPAKEHDAVSYKNICSALDSKAPELKVTLKCATTWRNFGSDVVSMDVRRNGQIIRSLGGMRLNNGQQDTLKLGWTDWAGSAAALKAGDIISVSITIGSDERTATGTCGVGGGSIALKGDGFDYSADVAL